jgi:organic hydroperoxide reductase OsmC/OhrA
MSEHGAEVRWQRDGARFTDGRYGRGHVWRFDGGTEVPASSSPEAAPLGAVAAAVDPEEAFIASLSSCHMLWFLALAAKRGFVVDRYRDAATGTLEKGADGRVWVTRVTLRPEVEFSGATRPTAAEHDALHHVAHERCFIAASVRTDVRCEPVDRTR